ncbi:hypothetical protein [Paenibacillus sp. YYML68]|uniref:hypothetical protein n=1 Tax=Paenibacillus sp. YYML68 TaxID=2909250 RepID=UPI0024932319|nr:hypothetical protein [Paenibacillus sp. YYML68]
MLVEIPEFISNAAHVEILDQGLVRSNTIVAICSDIELNITLNLKTQRECNLVFFNELNKENTKVIGKLLSSNAVTEDLLLGYWMSAHSAFRAMQANEGEGGQVAASAVPVKFLVKRNDGLQVFIDALENQNLEDGDIVVIADKPIAIATNRVIPRSLLGEADPKFLSYDDRIKLVSKINLASQISLYPKNILMIDYIDELEASLGAYNHNRLCYVISSMIHSQLGKKVDVVISDSDTGVDQAQPLIGFPTVGSTPLGVTAGLSIYEALRVSALAELVRGHNRLIPIVISKPSARNQIRPHIGSERNYPGMIHINLEQEFHRGLLTSVYWEVQKND